MNDRTGVNASDADAAAAADAGTDETSTVGTRRRLTPLWIATTLAVIFGLVYAYDVWEAVGNLVGLSLNAQSLDTQFSAFGWIVLVGAVVLPAVLFGIAFWLGRYRAPGSQVLLYVVGLGASAALSLDVYVLGFARLLV